MSRWKCWSRQGELKELIKVWIDTGSYREKIIDDVIREVGAKWQPDDVSKALDELIQDWLVVDDGTGSINVTEWSHDAIRGALGGDKSELEAMEFLKDKGVFHPDMANYGIIDPSFKSAEEIEAADAALMDVMPESDKVKRVEKAQSGEMLVSEVPDGAERVSSAVDDAINSAFKDVKCEFTVPEVIERAKDVSPVEMGKEIGKWIIDNVEQFIDNQDTVFRMYLNIRSDMGLPASSLYQRLYLSVYNADEGLYPAEEIDKAVAILNELLESAKKSMEEDIEMMGVLFRKMVYFYELTGFIVKDGKVEQALTQKMDGKVSINILEFDPVSLTSTVAQGIGQNEGGVIKEGDQKVILKREEIPAGFGIELEIEMSPKNAVPLAMY